MKRTKFLHRTRTDFLLIVIFNNHGIGKSSFLSNFTKGVACYSYMRINKPGIDKSL